MAILHRVWQDIRKGENIDLYATVLVAFLIVILNIFGVAQNLVAPLTLALLGLLAVALLGNRYQVEKLAAELKQPERELFRQKYPATLEQDLQRATELWLVGVTLSRTVKSNYSLFEEKLKRGGTMRVLLVDPDGDGVAMAKMREYGGRYDVDRIRNLIRGSLDDLCSLRAHAPDRLHCRVIDHPLGFGGLAVDPNTAGGILYLEHFSHKMPGGSVPKFVLAAQDGDWYDFFKGELQALWEDGEPWPCPS